MALFLQVFILILIAEMGDKTQFLMVAMASRYRIRDIVMGVLPAVLLLNGAAIGLGALLGGVLPTAWIGTVAGLAFLWFAYDSLAEEEIPSAKGRFERGAAWTVFGTFFLAELGDKTQLTALTVAATEEGLTVASALAVFFGATAGLLLADGIGLLVGYLLGKALPDRVFAGISFLIFAAFGIVKLLCGLEAMAVDWKNGKLFAILGTTVVGIAFAALAYRRVRNKGKGKHEETRQSKNRKSLSVHGQ